MSRGSVILCMNVVAFREDPRALTITEQSSGPNQGTGLVWEGGVCMRAYDSTYYYDGGVGARGRTSGVTSGGSGVLEEPQGSCCPAREERTPHIESRTPH